MVYDKCTDRFHFVHVYVVRLIIILMVAFSEGWYCTLGSTMSMPTNPVEGGKCLPGTYCPGASVPPTPCDPGMYCPTKRLAIPTGLLLHPRSI